MAYSFTRYAQEISTQLGSGASPQLVNPVSRLLDEESKQLRDVYFLGNVVGAIEPAGYLKGLKTSTKGHFVLVNVVLIEETYNRYFNLSPKNFVAGSVIAFAEDANNIIGKWVVLKNTYGKAVTLRAGYNKSEAGTAVSMNVLCFTRDSNSNWVIAPNTFDLDVSKYQAVIDVSASLLESGNGIRRFSGLHRDSVKFIDISSVLSTDIDDSFVEESSVIVETSTTPKDQDTSNSHQGTALLKRFSNVPPLANYDVIRAEVSRQKDSRNTYFSLLRFDRDKDVAKSIRDYYLTAFRNNVVADIGGKFTSTGKKKEYFLKDVLESFIKEKEDVNNIVSMCAVNPDFLFSQNTSYPALNDLNLVFIAFIDKLTELNIGVRTLFFLDQYKRSAELTKLLSNPYSYATSRNWHISKADALYFLFVHAFDDNRLGDVPCIYSDSELCNTYRNVLLVSNNLFSERTGSVVITRGDAVAPISVQESVTKGTAKYRQPFKYATYQLLEEVTKGVNKWLPIDDVYYVSEIAGIFECGKYGDINYDTVDFVLRGNKYYNSNPRDIIEYMDENGLICILGTDHVVASTHLIMETFIYEKSRSMADTPTGITDEEIAQGIANYEAEKGFSLEPEQKLAVNLMKSSFGNLSGQGGSGKTTISEVIVNIAISKGYKPVFTAPTAKAARRLAEVVGHLGTVTTMHSHFRISGTANLYWSPGDKMSPKVTSSGEEEKCIYILDEQSMSTIDVLYPALKTVSSTSLVYCLGDIKQLEPIGKGMPFMDMMTYLPSVELGVSKRAAANSGISLNCDIINNHPEEQFIQTDDFRIVSVLDDKIAKGIREGIINTINNEGVSPDNIYVISPYSSASKELSSRNLSIYLQDIFVPPGTNALFTYNDVTFLQDTRVIHAGSNDPNRLKYSYDKGVFTTVYSSGVMKGDIGKVRGIVPARNLQLNITEEGTANKTDYNLPNRDNSKAFVVLVEYWDPDAEQDLFAMYNCVEANAGYTEASGLVVFGKDLSNIELAQALTVHKFQGSQEKMIIMPISSKDNPRFVNRNLIYTGISRAQEKLVLIGNVKGTASVLNKGRGFVSTDGHVRTVYTHLKDMLGLEGA